MKFRFNLNPIARVLLIGSLALSATACNDDDDVPAVVVPPANVAPVVSSDAVTSAEEGVVYTYTLTATDTDASDTLVLASVTLPTWLTFDITSGELSGTPAAADVGDNAVSLTVTDGTDTTTQDFTIAVTAAPVVNTAPTFTSTGLAMGAVGTVYSYTATATDADVDDTLSFSSVTLPSWAAFNTDTAVLSGTPDTAGDYPVELSVTDGTDSVAQTFTIAVTEVSTNVALSIFETTERADWSSWLCCNATTTGQVVTDEDVTKDLVVEFTLDMTEGTVAGFTARDVAAGGNAVGGMPFDASAFTSTGVLQFDLKLVENGPAGAQPWFLKVESTNAEGGIGDIQLPLTAANEDHAAPEVGVWQTYTFNLSDLGGSLDQTSIDLVMVFPLFSGDSTGIVYRIDNVKIVEDGASSGDGDGELGSELLTNGDFENGLANWSEVGAVVADGDNMIFEAAIATATDNTYDVNQTQVFDITEGETYTFSFKAKASEERTMVAGIGRNGGADGNDFAGITQDITLTTEWQTFTTDITATGIGGVDGRVFFDMGGDFTGTTINIDDVSVKIMGGDSGGDTGPVAGITDIGDTGFVINGGFEAGDTSDWLAQGAEAQQDDMGTWLVKIAVVGMDSSFVRQQRMGEGVITAGQALTVSFDMKGSAEGEGGTVNAILFTEHPEGDAVSKTEPLEVGPPNAEWTNYSFDVTAGDRAGWGLTLLLQPICGAVEGCAVTAYFDNVSITAR